MWSLFPLRDVEGASRASDSPSFIIIIIRDKKIKALE